MKSNHLLLYRHGKIMQQQEQHGMPEDLQFEDA